MLLYRQTVIIYQWYFNSFMLYEFFKQIKSKPMDLKKMFIFSLILSLIGLTENTLNNRNRCYISKLYTFMSFVGWANISP